MCDTKLIFLPFLVLSTIFSSTGLDSDTLPAPIDSSIAGQVFKENQDALASLLQSNLTTISSRLLSKCIISQEHTAKTKV